MADADWPCWPSATVPLAHPGLLIADRYRLVKQIGVGAMGAVWLATDQRLNRQVALKQVVLQPGLDLKQASEARQRILREGRIAARLQHPHAVAIYDVTMQDGEPWLVMEYLKARSLATTLSMDGPLSERAAAKLGAQLADALDAAHQVGIVHRDVKPGNVLICPDGRAKLADFGIARAADDITVTQTGMLTGTPEFCAPEVAKGGPPTPAADMFSLGATLYAAVENRPPFELSGNAISQLETVASGRTRPPTKAGRLTPVITQLLSPEPEDRPSAAEVKELLEEQSGTGEGMSIGSRSKSINKSIKTVKPTRSTETPTRTTELPGMPSSPFGRVPGVLPPTPGPGKRSRTSQRRWLVGGLVAVATVAIAVAVTLVFTGNKPIDQVANNAAPPAPTQPPQPAVDQELTSVARTYYDQLPDSPAIAWQLITPKARKQLGGTAAYNKYWRNINTVRVLDMTPSSPPASQEHAVSAQLRLQPKRGQARTVTQRLVLVPGPRGGTWLIDNITPTSP